MFKPVIAVSALFLASLPAQALTLAQWTFETSLPTSAGPFAPEIGAGQASGFHASSAAVYSNPVGNGSAESFSSNNWAVGDYYQFSTSTTGFQGIALSWDQTSSNTGPRDFKLAFSTNGSTYLDWMNYTVLANGGTPNPSWSSGTAQPAYGFSFDMSSVSALDNQATVYFRLVDMSTVSANGGVVASAGSNRIDNFTVTAVSAVPEAGTFAMLLAGLTAVGFVARRRG